MRLLSAAIAVSFASGCAEREVGHSRSTPSQLARVIDAINCTQVDAGLSFPLETRDRGFYGPLSFEIANIHTNEALDGYHGPTVGKYILAIETYPDESTAQKRADEYRDLSRLAGVTEHDEHELGKMTVRCWGYRDGRRAYLLTTLAAMYSALEQRTHFVLDGIQTHAHDISEQE